MNILWSSMLLLGIAYGALQGRMPEVTDGVIQASREAVVLAVSLFGVTGSAGRPSCDAGGGDEYDLQCVRTRRGCDAAGACGDGAV